MNIHEDIMRFLAVKVKDHNDGHSIMMNNKAKEEEERVEMNVFVAESHDNVYIYAAAPI